MNLTVIVYECKPTELVPFPSEIKDESWTILQGEGELVDRQEDKIITIPTFKQDNGCKYVVVYQL